VVRILLTNAYSARNRGDAAIVLGMIEALRRTTTFADAEIRLSTADHPADGAWYPVPTVASFQSLRTARTRRPAAGLLLFLVVLLPLSVAWTVAWRTRRIDLPVPEDLRGLLREIAGADLVVPAGGGYLYTTSAVRGNVVLLETVLCFLLAALAGRPVCLWAQSIGPFAAAWQARLVRWALSRTALVVLREPVSRELVDGWRLPVPVRSAADAAFLLDARPPAGELGALGDAAGLRVGITVRRWFRDRERQASYERTMAELVGWLTGERGAAVVFIPQVTYAGGQDDDREAARRVAALAGRPDRVRLVEDELGASEVKWLCGRMDLFVGTRMHSNIFALSSGVPALAIAYQPKTDGIMTALGLEAWVLGIDGLTADALRSKVDELLERAPEVRAHLARVLPGVRDQALATGRLVADAFEGRPGDAG
jgi:colanic acid/amylovoran biosynthesis protein